jgi:hypothetical protein
MNKHIWEGWTVGSFIEELELPFRYHQKFKSRDEVKKWAMSEQPYYKKYIPEVVDYFWEKNDEKYADGGMMAKGGTVKKKPSASKPKPSKKVGKSVQDKHRFAKPAGWRWKEEAFQKRIIERKQLTMSPSKKMRDKYPDYVYYEDRLNKADAKPTRSSADSI